MNGVAVWRTGEIESIVRLTLCPGDSIVLEQKGAGKIEPHYFDTDGEAQEFIIKNAYALLSLGYRVVEDC